MYIYVCLYRLVIVVYVDITHKLHGKAERGQSVFDRQPIGTWWCVVDSNTNTLLLIRYGMNTLYYSYYCHIPNELKISYRLRTCEPK